MFQRFTKPRLLCPKPRGANQGIAACRFHPRCHPECHERTQSTQSFLEGLVMLATPGLRSWKLPLFLLYAMPNVLLRPRFFFFVLLFFILLVLFVLLVVLFFSCFALAMHDKLSCHGMLSPKYPTCPKFNPGLLCVSLGKFCPTSFVYLSEKCKIDPLAPAVSFQIFKSSHPELLIKLGTRGALTNLVGCSFRWIFSSSIDSQQVGSKGLNFNGSS